LGANRLHIRIVLATYNGASHLAAQLDSYAAQIHKNWSLDVSDDGSSDRTQEIVEEFATQQPDHPLRFSDGPKAGAASNFLFGLERAVADAPDAAIAISDQDDVWLPQKLEKAANWLVSHGAKDGKPLLWSCRTVLTDAKLKAMGRSRTFKRRPCFGNALVQNIVAGNTIVLSSAAAKIISRTTFSALQFGVPYHDWWIYLIASGVGVPIYQDEEPLVLYRQHETNLLGHHGPVRGRLNRLGMVAGRRYHTWISTNVAALMDNSRLLTDANQSVLREFERARQDGGAHLAAALPKLGIHRQNNAGDKLLPLLARYGRL
jgi:glycosyltransferase involved in cell wall biosynthesis